MQQMEEGTKLIDVDPDSKTPYSDVTQVRPIVYCHIFLDFLER